MPHKFIYSRLLELTQKDPKDWQIFHEQFAQNLTQFRSDRTELVRLVHQIDREHGFSEMKDHDERKRKFLLRDIDPFTVFGRFHRGIKDENRTSVMTSYGRHLGIQAPAPTSFNGVPVMPYGASWFFAYEPDRQPADIDRLWNLFELVRQLKNARGVQSVKHELCELIDECLKISGIKWNLTLALYWLRPTLFVCLDALNRKAIFDLPEFSETVKLLKEGQKAPPTGEQYLAFCDAIQFDLTNNQPTNATFNDFAAANWLATKDQFVRDEAEKYGMSFEYFLDEDPSPVDGPSGDQPGYGLKHVVEDGCFLDEERLRQILDSLSKKKNLILQGPPGTGKTWLARRLGYTLCNKNHTDRVESFQFHANVSYEDFVQGLRPNSEGQLSLEDGPFLRLARRAQQDASRSYVLVIEEINRGQPAHIFGELLTLLETDKRNKESAIKLVYADESQEPFYVPENLYIVGTMNTADRSLAVVDFALRRRFAFITLEPQLNEAWRTWCEEKFGASFRFWRRTGEKVSELNRSIASDSNLGQAYAIGHSYAVPTPGERFETDDSATSWFENVVANEIRPLLEEYWFDQSDRVEEAISRLNA